MRKKNLDKLFQEKLQNFSEAPDEKVWHSIEASLDKKKKSRKVIPIWWKLGGVAAVVAIALFVINPFEETQGINPAVTNVEKQVDSSDIRIKNQKIEESTGNPESELVNFDSNATDHQESSSKDNPSMVSSENEATNSSGEKKKTLDLRTASENNNAQVTEIDHPEGQNPNVSPNTANKVLENGKETAVAISDNSDVQNNGTVRGKNKNVESSGNHALATNELPMNTESNIVQIEDKAKEEGSEDPKKKSIFDEITAKEAEEEMIAEAKNGKWSAGPSIAPVYFDAIGQGSPVHSIFVPNSKSGDLNLSYGLSVAYEISDKLKVRSGIHKVDYSYSTNDVEFSSSLESSALGQIANVNYSVTSKNLIVGSSASASNTDVIENMALVADDFSGQGLSQNGVMAQQFGYLEVPIELEYGLLDSKFGVNLIGGVSSLFLVDNSISLTSGELTTEMGRANNVNSVNFSTNFGIGVNYKFTPTVQFNVEPVFKYQLNTFSQTDGTFQPFTVGVYSGVSFKF